MLEEGSKFIVGERGGPINGTLVSLAHASLPHHMSIPSYILPKASALPPCIPMIEIKGGH